MKQQDIDTLVDRLSPLDEFINIMARNNIDVVPLNDKIPPLLYDRGQIAIEINPEGRVIRAGTLRPPTRQPRVA